MGDFLFSVAFAGCFILMGWAFRGAMTPNANKHEFKCHQCDFKVSSNVEYVANDIMVNHVGYAHLDDEERL